MEKDKVSFLLRTSRHDMKLIKAAAREMGYSMNQFVSHSVKLMAVLCLKVEDKELVVRSLADRLFTVVEALHDATDEVARRQKRA